MTLTFHNHGSPKSHTPGFSESHIPDFSKSHTPGFSKSHNICKKSLPGLQYTIDKDTFLMVDFFVWVCVILWLYKLKGVAWTIVVESHATSHEVYIRMGANYNCWNAGMPGTQIGMPFTMYGVFCLVTFPNFNCYKFWVYGAYFRTELIGASSVIVTCKTGELFAFFTTLLNVNVP